MSLKNYLEKHQIVTGEKIQQIADVYIGEPADFQWNPVIFLQKEKQKTVDELLTMNTYDNPRIVFCYSHLIPVFAGLLDKFLNNFVLITHNSDFNVDLTPSIDDILKNPKVCKWYAQNILMWDSLYQKLQFLPIGIANSQWPHGNLDVFDYIYKNYDVPEMKCRLVYFSFKIDTNAKERKECFDALKNKDGATFLPFAPFAENLLRMLEYKYCICPVGNGVDTHRLWEAYYLKVVPIMIINQFSVRLKTMGFPIILTRSWEELDIHKLPLYSSYDFSYVDYYLNMNNLRKEIFNSENDGRKSLEIIGV